MVRFFSRLISKTKTIFKPRNPSKKLLKRAQRLYDDHYNRLLYAGRVKAGETIIVAQIIKELKADPNISPEVKANEISAMKSILERHKALAKTSVRIRARTKANPAHLMKPNDSQRR